MRPGYSRRFFALLIDVIVLSVPLFCLGFAFYDFFVSLGDYGRLFGVALGLLYFGILNSAVGGGQTFGKRLLGLRVVRLDGEALSPGASFLRAAILIVPFQLNGLEIPVNDSSPILLLAISLILFAGLLGVVYYYIFNRDNRRVLHDFAVGSIVIACDAGYEENRPLRKESWHIHAGYAMLILFVVAVGVNNLTRVPVQSLTKRLGAVQASVMSFDEVRYASVYSGISTEDSNAVGDISIALQSNVPPAELKEKLPAIYARLVGDAPFILQTRRLSFTIVRGFDLGFARITETDQARKTIGEWELERRRK